MGSKTSQSSKTSVKPNYKVVSEDSKDAEYYVTPEFIYGGPFIPVKKPSPFIDSTTPMNLPQQGTFTRSFAYFSLRDRMPVILTKVIDALSKKGGTPDVQRFLEIVTKLKNDLMTNKEYEPFTVDSDEGRKWNEWITNQMNKKYFNNTWLFTECYVYRKLYEGCELINGLKTYDYFSDQKKQSFQDNLKPMCLVADKVVVMSENVKDKDKRKADLISLLKVCLWSNKCDLSLSLGEKVAFGEGGVDPPPPPPAKGKPEPPKPVGVPGDPFLLILDYKDKLLVDDTGKIADQIVVKADNMQKAIDANTVFKHKCSCHRLAKNVGTQLCVEEGEPLPEGEAPPEIPKIPCPSKMTVPYHVMVDMVLDNAGYELFTDLCLASFLIDTKIVQMVRFHVKKMPWFVSDVTTEDFKYVIQQAETATFNLNVELPPGPEGEVSIVNINNDNLNILGKKWTSLLNSGKFVIMDEDYWTYPQPYCEMKKLDYNLYRRLQYAIGVVFKGDLNYRKLLADRNVNPYSGLEPCLQGFIPAPIIALRTVKSELICGLPKGRYDVLNKLDPNWMRTGNYGVIQYCPKAEPLKVSEKPCIDYCTKCFGVVCPEHKHDM